MKKLISLVGFAFCTPLIILAPALVATNVSVQSTRLPVGQLLEVLLPFAVLCVVYVFALVQHFPNRKLSLVETGWLMLCFFIFGLYTLGNGIHFSAQTLNQFVMTNKILGELQSVATLFNEKLTHIFWMPGLMLLPITLAGWEILDNEKASPLATTVDSLKTAAERMFKSGSQFTTQAQQLIAALAGGWYGSLLGLALLEAQVAKQAIMLIVLCIGSVSVVALVRKKLTAPTIVFTLVSSTCMLTIIVLWRLKFGGFPEPLNVLF
jgi:hypothetical protein